MARSSRSYAIAAAVAIGLASPLAAASDQPSEPMAVFRQILDRFIDGSSRGDSAAMTALFTEDAILMPPGKAPPIQGKDNIRRFLDEYVVTYKHENQKITPTELMMGGPKSMIDAGTWSSDIREQGGTQATHFEGTYLAVGIIVDGRWKLWATAWQVTAPPSNAFGSSTADPSAPTNK